MKKNNLNKFINIYLLILLSLTNQTNYGSSFWSCLDWIKNNKETFIAGTIGTLSLFGLGYLNYSKSKEIKKLQIEKIELNNNNNLILNTNTQLENENKDLIEIKNNGSLLLNYLIKDKIKTYFDNNNASIDIQKYYTKRYGCQSQCFISIKLNLNGDNEEKFNQKYNSLTGCIKNLNQSIDTYDSKHLETTKN